MSTSAEQAFLKFFDAELSDVDVSELQISGRSSAAYPNKEDLGWWQTNGPAMVERWQRWRARTPWDIWVAPDGTLGIELELTVSFAGERVKLFIDRVFSTDGKGGRPVPVDIKTGSRTPPGRLQLGIYGTAIEQTWDVRVAGGCYWMARTGEATPVVTLHEYTPALIGAYVRREKIARERGIYLPRVSEMCKSCGVGAYCAINGGSMAHMDPDYSLMI